MLANLSFSDLLMSLMVFTPAPVSKGPHTLLSAYFRSLISKKDLKCTTLMHTGPSNMWPFLFSFRFLIEAFWHQYGCVSEIIPLSDIEWKTLRASSSARCFMGS